MSSKNGENPAVYTFDGFRLEVSKRAVYAPDGKLLPLKAKAFETLLYLVENAGRLIERDEIMEAVWPGTVVEENNLTQHISSLRHLFGDTPDEHRFIVTVPGHGYNFVADVQSEAHLPKTRHGEPQTDKVAAESRKWFIVLTAGVVISLLALGFFYKYEPSPPGSGSIKSIAVLPFKPITEQERNPSLEMGMTIDLITKLGGAESLRVRPFSAVMRYGSPEQDAIAAGNALGVDAVLDGNIQMSADRVRISVRLINVIDSKQMWAESFDEENTDIFAVQDSISERVANAFRAKLSEYARKRYTDNVAAYQLYLNGQIHKFRLEPSEIKVAIGYFQKAIDLDPNYALAYAGIADCYRALILSGEFRPSETIEHAVEATEKAIKIDPGLAEAQTSLGINYLWFNRDWVASESAFKRAIQIDPNSAFTHHHYAHLLSNIGRHDEAIAEVEIVKKLDPYSAFFFTVQGLVYHQAGKLDEAFVRFNEATKLNPNLWLTHMFKAIAYIDVGRYDEAIAAAQKAGGLNQEQSISIAYEGVALARLGRMDEARRVLDGLLKRSDERYVMPYHIAIAYMGLGDRKNALLWLEKSFSEQDAKIVFLKTDHIWDDLRSETRFIELMKKMNLND